MGKTLQTKKTSYYLYKYTKKCVAKHRLFVTYLYVNVYDNIYKENSSKFQKSPNARAFLAVIGTDCPVIDIRIEEENI